MTTHNLFFWVISYNPYFQKSNPSCFMVLVPKGILSLLFRARETESLQIYNYTHTHFCLGSINSQKNTHHKKGPENDGFPKGISLFQGFMFKIFQGSMLNFGRFVNIQLMPSKSTCWWQIREGGMIWGPFLLNSLRIQAPLGPKCTWKNEGFNL